MQYEEFLNSKKRVNNPTGFDCEPTNKYLFDFQRDIVKWALKKGKAAVFLDTGLGKTIIQLSWADEICKYTNGKILILAPLAVSKQTIREGLKFGIEVTLCRGQQDVKNGINITNYEMLQHFNPDEFIGVVLDESSIIKSFTGKTTQEMLELFKYTEYKLACTATPSPNDYVELGNHAEFLGVMTRPEMLATFFIHDGGETAKWRLKGHAENEFWRWLASWAMVVKTPEDLGYDGSKYKLPKLNITTHIVDSPNNGDMFVVMPAQTLDERREARKESIDDRVGKAVELVKGMDNCLIWCDYNNESEMLSKLIVGAVEVTGADKPEHKESAMLGFATGEVKFLVTKAKICGFGMNWQNCNNMIFCGLSDSYERFYQAIRRCYRFGQTKEVNVHVIISEREESVLANVKRKEEQAEQMSRNMVALTSEILKNEIKNTTRNVTEYKPCVDMKIPTWLVEAC